jgi:hypothetical protein
MKGVIAEGTEPTREALLALDACPSMEGLDLATKVSTAEPYTWGDPNATHHIAASCGCLPKTIAVSRFCRHRRPQAKCLT